MAGFKAPKGIAGYKVAGIEVVEECLCGYSEGFDHKYDVFLKEGYAFSGGRMEGSRSGCFHTVADFRYAAPVKVD